ncbi:hypothetical protein GGS24DRAFT_63045 [Hypoxylon argillaceum]|nr:hypothetical protein GGS24DRAFT_63045 [Hypoxylon argillaceum]
MPLSLFVRAIFHAMAVAGTEAAKILQRDRRAEGSEREREREREERTDITECSICRLSWVVGCSLDTRLAAGGRLFRCAKLV